MKHVSDRQLLDLLASGSRPQGPLAEHLDACAECRERLGDYTQTWEILGRADVEEKTPPGLAKRIMQAAEKQAASAVRPGLVLRIWRAPGPLGRVAAVVLAAALGGFGVGRLTATAPAHAAPPKVTSSEAAEAAYLDELCSPPIGISESLSMSYEDPDQQQQEQQP